MVRAEYIDYQASDARFHRNLDGVFAPVRPRSVMPITFNAACAATVSPPTPPAPDSVRR